MAIFADQKLQESLKELYQTMGKVEGKTKVALIHSPNVVVDPQQVAFEIGRTRQELAEHFVLIHSLIAVVNALLPYAAGDQKGYEQIIQLASDSMKKTGEDLLERWQKIQEELNKPQIVVPKGPING